MCYIKNNSTKETKTFQISTLSIISFYHIYLDEFIVVHYHIYIYQIQITLSLTDFLTKLFEVVVK